MSTVAERVARGAALLDEGVPGWAERIDLTELELASCYSCVLGQLFALEYDAEDGSPFGAGIKALGIEGSVRGPVWYGFDGASIEGLEAEWWRVIDARQAALVGATSL
jgi:hypothetical protein